MAESATSPGVDVAGLMSQGLTADDRGVIVAPAQRDLDELARSLADWLRGRLPGARDVRLSNLSYPRGSGQSHETILFDAEWIQAREHRRESLVVRIKPSGFVIFQDDMFVEQYEIMRVLGDLGTVPVARTRWLEEDPSVLGAPFFVMERVSGRVAVSIPSYFDEGWVAEATAEQRALLWRNCIDALAAIQSVPVSAVPFLASPTGLRGFDQEWDRWERFLAWIEEFGPLPEHRRVLRRLADTAPAHRPEGIVWGDARIGNMMVDDDFEVVALMDWEQPSLGGALHDLGWWLATQRGKVVSRGGRLLPGVPERDEMIAQWGRATGVSTDGIDWYEAFAGFKLACSMVRLLRERGQRPPGGDWNDFYQLRQARELAGL
ncbi:MAG: phosphotransferase family protein [Microbacterium sp.]